jgi:hypothetical protein
MPLSSVVADRRAFSGLTTVLAAGLAGPPTVVGLNSVGVPSVAGAVAVIVAAAIALTRPAVRGPLIALRRGVGTRISIAFLLGLVVATGYNVRLSEFMLDATRTDLSVFPNRKFFREHACLSSYTEAGRFAAEGLNIYELERYVIIPKPGEYKDRYIGPISVDIYQYPPTFLILPYPAVAAGIDFFTVRRVWFFIQSLLLLTAIAMLASWIGGPAGIAALLLAPVLWIAPTTRLGLQVGNFQLTAFPVAVLAMIAFDRARNSAGGLALGFVAASKIFPGVLGLVLMATRRWKAIAWTIGWSVALSLLALMLVGSKPFTDFLIFQLPRIESGEAFFWTEDPLVAPINHSIYGLVTKLRLLGVPMTGAHAGARVSSVYAAIIFVLALAAGWRLHRFGSRGMPSEILRIRHAQAWLALLTLASLRSPFVPDAYGYIGTLWLLTIFAAEHRWKGSTWMAFAAAAIAVSLILDGGAIPSPVPTWIVLLTLAIQLLVLAFNAAMALGRHAPTPARVTVAA